MKLCLPKNFIQITHMLFAKAKVLVSLNGTDTEMIAIQRGVRQGCPLPPYLFLFVEQALNASTKFQL